MSGRIVLAVDGGNSKTELALVREDGELLAFVRGGGSSPHHLGIERAFDVLDGLFARAAEEARVEAPVAVAQLLLAGVDFPSEVNARGRARREQGLGAPLDRRQRHVRRPPRRHRPRLGRRHRLRRRDQLRRRRSRRAAHALPGARPDHRRLGRRAGPRHRGRLGGRAQRGRPRPAARRSSARCRRTSASLAERAGRGDALRPRSTRRASSSSRRSSSPRPRTIPSPPSIRDRLASRGRRARPRRDRPARTRRSDRVDVVLGGGLFQSGDAGLVACGGRADCARSRRTPRSQVAEAPPVLGAALLGARRARRARDARTSGCGTALAAPEQVSASGG